MAQNLVIVESPTKAKTIKRYLGQDFQVAASVGHVLDLPKNRLGVKVEDGFTPEYQVIAGKAKVLEQIRKAAENKQQVYLATDPDREGEAIAWHVYERLGKARARARRILLHEITPAAVKQALAAPTQLNLQLYEAQQARRILDRLVGYQLSPLLWEKVGRGLSAGRVQSVALRIIVDREHERERFRAEEYWTIEAELEAGAPPPFGARLYSFEGRRADNRAWKISAAEARAIVAALGAAPFKVVKVERKEVRRAPSPPFITSRLQQEAARQLRFSPSRTMKIAQRLYEGVELGDGQPVGLITYMRTDSPRVSDQAIANVRAYIERRYGADYLPEKPHLYRAAKRAQEAHEAIRPTALDYDPDSLTPYLAKDELALYSLIFKRFVSSQMNPARYDRTSAEIEAGAAVFRATGQVLRFDGFTRVYVEGRDDVAEDDERTLPALAEGDTLRLVELKSEQHFTEPPPRFTQATLIRELEERGIGRPSTYATIMASILDREYVQEDASKRLRPTTLGRIVSELLVGSFPDIVEVGFTAQLEERLDQVEEGRQSWVEPLRDFYGPFSRRLEEARTRMPPVKRTGYRTDVLCPRDQAPMVIRWGRSGEFLACSNYPRCRHTAEFERDEQGRIVAKQAIAPQLTDELCEKCGKPMVRRRSRFGEFLGCSGYPQCDATKPLASAAAKTGVKCPSCAVGELVQRRSRRGRTFYGCSRYPQCRFAVWERPVAQPCPECGAPYLLEKTTKRDGARRLCPNRECGYQAPVEAPSQAASSQALPGAP